MQRKCLLRKENTIARISTLVSHQCDQIWLCLNGLGDQFSNKTSPNIWKLLGQFWKQCFLSKSYCAYFLGNYTKIGLLCILPSGHTGSQHNFKQHLLKNIKPIRMSKRELCVNIHWKFLNWISKRPGLL